MIHQSFKIGEYFKLIVIALAAITGCDSLRIEKVI